MATDNKVPISADVVKRASAKIRELTDQLNKATAVSKYASLKLSNRKRAEAVDAVVQELTADVAAKLTDAGVEPEVIEQATDVVEMAVTEALSADLPEDGAVSESGASEDAEAVIDEETAEELAELAASEDEDEMVKEAALKLLNRKMDKRAFGQEIVKLAKKAATTVYTGGRMGTRKSASHSAGGLSPAERALVDSMYK